MQKESYYSHTNFNQSTSTINRATLRAVTRETFICHHCLNFTKRTKNTINVTLKRGAKNIKYTLCAACVRMCQLDAVGKTEVAS
jgi:ferredoxin